MWPELVIIIDEFTDQIIQVLSAKDHEVIEGLNLQGLSKPLGVGIQIRTLHWKALHFRALAFQDGFKHVRELAVSIA